MNQLLLNYKVTVILLFCLSATSFQLSAKEVEKQNMERAPFSFIENKGQITDQHYKARKDVQFKLETGMVNIFVGNGAIHYQWNKLTNPHAQTYTPNPWNKPAAIDDGSNYKDPEIKYSSYRMDVVLKGANTNAKIIKTEKQNYFEQYYTEGCGTNGARAYTYNKITYQNIYPNIDWVLYTNAEGLKYDFVVHPGGDIANIQIEYKGATSLTLKNGAIVAANNFGSITEAAPYTYLKEGSKINSAYKIEGNTISFDIDAYHKTNTLVIDPSLEWATYYGGTNADNSYALVADSAGNVYMAGSTNNSSNIVTSGSHQTTYAGNKDGMIIKFTEAGIRLWATYYGGTGNDDFFSATTDDSHDIYIAGLTSSTSDIATAGAHQTTYGGGSSDCFLVKMTPSGTRTWATYFGGSDNEKTNIEYQVFIGCDSTNNIYMVGNTRSTNGISSSGAHQTSNGGNIDGFLAKFNGSGVRQWATYLGGTDNDNMRKLAFDISGNVYVAGEMRSGGKATSGAHQTSIGGNNDAYLIKFNSSGVQQWATYYGGTGSDSPQGLSLDYSGGYLFMSGSTNSTSSIVTTGAHSTSLNGGGTGSTSDAFLVKFTSNGVRLWGTYFGGPAVDHSGDLIIDGAGNPGFTGTTSSTSGIATATAHQLSNGGNSNFDAMFVIFTQNGSLSWASYYGGSSQDYGYGINNAAQNIIYITGFTSSTNNIALSGHQNTMAGSSDAFLAKFTPDTTSFIYQPFIDTVFCQEDTFTLQYGVTSKFYSNNVFTVQLSDASGNFSSPLNIGTKSDSVGGNIFCTIPNTASGGSNYRIRIVATSPADTSFDNGNSIDVKPKPVKPIATSNSTVCDNDTLKLFATTTTPGVSYLWQGPFSFFTSQQNPIRTSISTLYSGDYIVKATINGCSRWDTASVTIVKAALPPTLTVNNPICTGDSIKLTIASSTSAATFSWTGPNNFSSTSTTPYITNVSSAHDGYYVGTAHLNGCITKDSINVTTTPTINFNPTISVTPGTTVCPTTDINFSASNVPNGSTYLWTGPNGFITAASSPTLFNSRKVDSGYYKVVITANQCSIEEDSIYINITDTIQAPNITSNTPVCEGDSLKIVVTSNYANPSYEITEPSGFVNVGVQKITYANATTANGGKYIVKLSVNGCTGFDTTVVTIKPTPATPTVSNTGPVCEGENITLNTTATGSVTYEWEGPNNYTATIANPTINNTTAIHAGVYTLRTVLNGCKSAGGNTTVIVNENPKPVAAANNPICENSDLKFTLAGGNTGYTYNWIGPGGFTSNGMEPIRTNAQLSHSGSYIVTATSTEGCTGKDTASVEVIALPLQPNATSNSPICEEDGLVLKDEVNTAADLTYIWTGPNNYYGTGNTTGINPVPSLAQGRYYVTVNRRGCTRRDSTDVIVKPKPIAPIASSNNPVQLGNDLVLTVTNQQPNTTYSWTGPHSFSQPSADATVPNVIVSSGGTYIVTATLDGCQRSEKIIIDIVPIKPAPEEFLLYPNPNNGEFSIRGELTFDEIIPIEVVNILGMSVYKSLVASVNKKIEHKVSLQGYLASGVYFFRATVNGKNKIIPFTVY